MADRVVATLGDSLVRESDSALLDGPFWLNDRLIAFYFDHLHRSNFEGSEKLCFLSPEVSQFLKLVVKEEMAAFVDPLNLEEKEVILMAVNDASDPMRPGGSHWSLLVYTSQARQFYHLDSCPGTNLEHARQMAKKIHEFFTNKQKKSGTRVSSDVQITEVDVLKQKNGYDCGVHVLLNAEHATRHFFVYGHHRGLELIDPDQVKRMRAKIKAVLQRYPSPLSANM